MSEKHPWWCESHQSDTGHAGICDCGADDKPPEPAPSHFGWMGFVPVWAWDVDHAAPVLSPRFFLPEFLLDLVAGMQAVACEVLDMEPVLQLYLRPLGPRQARWWRAECRLAGTVTQ